MKRRSGLIGPVRPTRKGKRVAEKVDDEPESQQLGLSLTDIPSHIIVHILKRLPIKYVFICKCVCTSWKAMISDPYFAELHFQHAPVGLMIRLIAHHRVSRILHLVEYEPEKFENNDNDQFCCCGFFFMKPECNCHLKLEHKFKLPLRGAERDETKKRGRPRRYISCDPKDDRFHVVNSCNGFLCLGDLTGDNFVVCNPVTGEFIRLPEATRIDLTNEPWHQELYPGFGFQPKTNEYKVVRILNRRWGFRGRESIMAIEMHTLGASTWRNLGVDPRDIHGLGFPTCVSGALHWIGSYQTKSTILCFDFESERFQPFPSPPHLFKNNTENISMGELRGSLYICDSTSMDTPVRMWVMKKYGIGESWSQIFSVDTMSRHCWPYGGLYWPVKHFNNGVAILLWHSSNCYIYYEPKNYGFKIFKVRGALSTAVVEPIPHIPSLISLKSAVKGDNIEVLNVHSRCAKFNLEEENEVLFMAKVKEVTNMYCISSDDEE